MSQKYKLTGSNHYHDGDVMDRGDVFEPSDRELAAFPHKFEAVESEDEKGSTEAPFDPADYTVSELKDQVADLSEHELDLIYQSEADNKNRETALDVIDNDA